VQQTPERAWPADASSVVLQQSARDLDRAFGNGWAIPGPLQSAGCVASVVRDTGTRSGLQHPRCCKQRVVPLNFGRSPRAEFESALWASLKGKRKGPKVRAPRFKQRRGAPSIRFLSHVFRTGERSLRLSKVGPVPIGWSRSLPSAPSSVTVIRDASGRYFASFVVAVEPTPLIAHGRALGLEDLNVSGMVKNNKLAGSIADAGWRQCRTLLESRAKPYRRELVVVKEPLGNPSRAPVRARRSQLPQGAARERDRFSRASSTDGSPPASSAPLAGITTAAKSCRFGSGSAQVAERFTTATSMRLGISSPPDWRSDATGVEPRIRPPLRWQQAVKRQPS